MRYSKAYVEKAIEHIQKNFGIQLTLDHCSQGYKIERNGRGLSPRGSPNDMMTWLDAFEQGLLVHQPWHAGLDASPKV